MVETERETRWECTRARGIFCLHRSGK